MNRREMLKAGGVNGGSGGGEGCGAALLWRGTALERPSPSRPETMQWSDATAEDLARTLLIRLRREGIVKLGAGGDADPI